MKTGINRRMRDVALRQASTACRIRVPRQRHLPTKHGHAGLCSSTARVIREYQSDSLSKRPASSFLPGPWHQNFETKKNE